MPWLISGVFGIIALYVSVQTYRRKYAEVVQVSVYPSKRPYKIAWTHSGDSEKNVVLYQLTEWECVLINTGERPINIVDWGVLIPPGGERVSVMEGIWKIKRAEAERVSAEIIEVHKNMYLLLPDEEIPRPLDLAPGVSKTFKVKLGIAVHRPNMELVQAELNANRIGDNTLEIFKFLREKRLSLFGPERSMHHFPIYFQTARGAKFFDFGKWED